MKIKGWQVDETDYGAEAMPVDDLIGHEHGEHCACLPLVEFVEPNGWLVLHAAWDGRE